MALTNAEKQARFRTRRDRRWAEMQARIAELEKLLAAAQPGHKREGPPPLPRTAEELWQRRAERTARCPPPEPEPAIVEETLDDLRAKLAAKEKEIKGLRTQLRNRRAEHMYFLDQQARQGKVLLDKAGRRLILSCLHPDSRDPNPQTLEKAFKLFQNLGL